MVSFMKSEDGYFTVESSLIMPLVVFLITSTILISTMYYQNILSALENQKLMTDFSQYWPNYYKDVETGAIPYNKISKKGVYSSFNILDSYKDKKVDYLKSLLRTRKQPAKLFKNYKIDDRYHSAEIRIQDFLLSKKLYMKTYATYNFSFINNEETLESSVLEPVSVIRNIDYVIETIKNSK